MSASVAWQSLLGGDCANAESAQNRAHHPPASRNARTRDQRLAHPCFVPHWTAHPCCKLSIPRSCNTGGCVDLAIRPPTGLGTRPVHPARPKRSFAHFIPPRCMTRMRRRCSSLGCVSQEETAGQTPESPPISGHRPEIEWLPVVDLR